MIIIYQARDSFLPVIAGNIHLDGEINQNTKKWFDEQNWRKQPLKYIGKDHFGNIICCLAYTRFKDLYNYALTGISDIFQIQIKLIDVESIIKTEASSHLKMATCLNLIHLISFFYPRMLSELQDVLRKNVSSQ